MDNKEVRNEFHEFEQWRNDVLEASAENCTKLYQLDSNVKTKEIELVEKVPKCLVHLTRKMCKCDQECISESFVNSYLDHSCRTYDRENLWYDTTYKDCDYLGKRVEDGKLLPVDVYNSMISIMKDINSGITNLCDSNSNFENLLCKSYDLRDICRNNTKCMGFSIKDVPKKYCKNGLYEDQMDEIERILGKKIRTNIREVAIPSTSNFKEEFQNDKKVPNCVEKYYFNSSDIIVKFDSEKKPHLIIKRDLSNIDIPDITNLIKEYNSLDSKFKTIESTDIERNNFYSMMSLSIISTLLFFFLVFLGYKDTKNRKIVVPTIVMTLFMLFISIYSSMTMND